MKFSRYILILLAVIIAVSSCEVYQPKQKKEIKELEIVNDAEPPSDYDPIFITKSEYYNPEYMGDPKVVVSYVDNRQPNVTRAHVHIIDSNKTYITGAAQQRYMNIWCIVRNKYKGEVEEMKKFEISEYTEADRTPLAMAIVMDHSGSMGERRALAVQKAIKQRILSKKNEDKFSLIRYDHRINIESPLSGSYEGMIKTHKINGLQGYGGGTAIIDAVAKGIESLNGAGQLERKVVVIFTDGWDNQSKMDRDSVIEMARAKNVMVCAVDFGANINKGYMKEIARRTGGLYHHIYKTEEFDLVFLDIYKRLKNSYVIEFTPSGYGEHELEIKLCLPERELTTNTTFDNTPDIGHIGILHINFDFASSKIKKNSYSAIEKIYQLMDFYPEMVVEIRGHTDDVGKESSNQKLSEKRAQAVADYLIEKGIEPNRLVVIGFGEAEPIADNSTDEGRAQNRRTEFKILKK